MIVEEKRVRALRAVHLGIIGIRQFAYEREDHERIALALDELEYLLALILEKDEKTAIFERALLEYGPRYQCEGMWQIYSEEEPDCDRRDLGH